MHKVTIELISKLLRMRAGVDGGMVVRNLPSAVVRFPHHGEASRDRVTLVGVASGREVRWKAQIEGVQAGVEVSVAVVEYLH